MFTLFSTHYFWLALGASTLNSAVLAVAAGFAAKTDGGLLVVVVLLLTIASHLLSCLFFLSGGGVELFVHRLLDKRHLHPQSSRFQTVTRYIDRYEKRFIFMYRFIPGLRFISPYIMGLGQQRFWPFFALDWFASLLWASLFGGIGYLFGATATRALHDFSRYDGPVFGALFALVVAVLAGKLLYRRHRAKARDATMAAPPGRESE
jgi:membrane protein DedA with SNARE-associated domain